MNIIDAHGTQLYVDYPTGPDAVAFVDIVGNEDGPAWHPNAQAAVELASKMFSAAGIDIVGAAQKVVEAQTALDTRIPFVGEVDDLQAMRRARVDAIRVLAVELAKLDVVRT